VKKGRKEGRKEGSKEVEEGSERACLTRGALRYSNACDAETPSII